MLFELSQLLVVGGEKRAGTALSSAVEVLNHRPGNG